MLAWLWLGFSRFMGLQRKMQLLKEAVWMPLPKTVSMFGGSRPQSALRNAAASVLSPSLCFWGCARHSGAWQKLLKIASCGLYSRRDTVAASDTTALKVGFRVPKKRQVSNIKLDDMLKMKILSSYCYCNVSMDFLNVVSTHVPPPPPHQVIVFVVNHGCGCLVWVRIGFAEPKNVIEVKTNAPGKPDACQCFFSVISSWKVLSSGHNLTIFSISSCMKSVWLASTSAILNMDPLSLVTKDWQNVLQCRVPPWKHSLSICTGLQVNQWQPGRLEQRYYFRF